MIRVTPHPSWVAHIDLTLEPIRQRILDLPVVSLAADNCLDDASIRSFVVEFYPIVRDFPRWLEVLLQRSPPDGEPFFRDNIRVERRHDAMWRAMGDGFGVTRKQFQKVGDTNEAVETFHAFLTRIGESGAFASAVAATNYAVEGVAQRIATKALQGLRYNQRLGERGRWWLEEHSKYDDEHPVHALELIKACVGRGEDDVGRVEESAARSLDLMCTAMDVSYHP